MKNKSTFNCNSDCSYYRLMGLFLVIMEWWTSKRLQQLLLVMLEAQYQRRADMMPQLVKIVKAYAKHERGTFDAVTKARNAATQVHLDADNLTPEKMKQFEAAQNQVAQAFSRLIAVAEAYPELKASENFKALQVQEGRNRKPYKRSAQEIQ